MKKCYLLVTTLLFAIGSSAQDRGEDYFAVGELDKARAIFGSRISGDPAETNYYLGEIARGTRGIPYRRGAIMKRGWPPTRRTHSARLDWP